MCTNYLFAGLESSLMLSSMLSRLTGHGRSSFAKRTSPCHWFHTRFHIVWPKVNTYRRLPANLHVCRYGLTCIGWGCFDIRFVVSNLMYLAWRIRYWVWYSLRFAQYNQYQTWNCEAERLCWGQTGQYGIHKPYCCTPKAKSQEIQQKSYFDMGSIRYFYDMG